MEQQIQQQNGPGLFELTLQNERLVCSGYAALNHYRLLFGDQILIIPKDSEYNVKRVETPEY